MGLCCSRSALPVVDDTGRQHHIVEPKVTVPDVPTLEFDVVSPEATANFGLSFSRNTVGAGHMEESMHTISEFSILTPDFLGRGMSGTLRDDGGNSLVTNGLNEVLSDHVNRFVTGVLELTTSEPINILEESFYGASMSTLNRTRRGRGHVRGSVAGTLSREQLRYLDEARSMEDRLLRLIDLEQMSRQEIFGAWKMNSALLLLAMKRIMPTIRRFRVPVQEKERRRRPPREVLIIHAKDVDLQMDDDNSFVQAVESPEVGQGGDDYQGPTFSPQESADVGSKPPPVAERYQLLALTAREISITAGVQAQVVSDTWDFLSLPEAANHLNSGNVFFRFVCCPVRNLGKDSLEMIDTCINLTSFQDEVRENNVPKVNIYSAEEQHKNVSILVKTMYLLPGVRLSQLTVELLSSLDYQRNCQPGNNKFENPDTENTFRTIKTIIRFVFSVTIQMKVSEITDEEVLNSFKDMDGMVPSKVLLLERTKRNIHKTDSTIKVRSLLLYYPVNDGLMVTNQTIVINSSLPTVVSSIMHTFGSQGAAEAAQTAKQTRQYMIHRFGDTRS